MNDPTTQTIGDVVNMLQRTYHMNVRLKGNTISYALPYRGLNGGKVQAVRGSKLGARFTVAGIMDYMKPMMNFRRNTKFQRMTIPSFTVQHLMISIRNGSEEMLHRSNKRYPSTVRISEVVFGRTRKILPPPSDDGMEKIHSYQDRMDYTVEEMKSIRYKMSVYDHFNDEYNARLKYAKEHPSKEQLHEKENVLM